MIGAFVVSGPGPMAAAAASIELYECKLFTTARTHAAMNERHGVISE
ncbi:MAG: hypothetical protein HZA11_10945, partial [Nitrospirae bacterium]|nr:hypothetical protein [Nitrospirota bacterium]